MALSKDELEALSANNPEEIKEWLPQLAPEDISALYDLEVAKEQPRNDVVEMLMAPTNNQEAPAEPAVSQADPDALNKNKPYNMIWHNDTKCILQNNTVYNAVTGELIEKLK